jgi:hypothetical protein
VAPAALVAADALPGADDAEPGTLVEPEAGGVLGEDPSLNGPDSRCFRGGDERLQQRGPAAGQDRQYSSAGPDALDCLVQSAVSMGACRVSR